MENKQIVFTKVNKAELLDVNYPQPKENDVIVQTEFSTISCGTEKANIIGEPSVSISSKENEPVVFPRYSGYSSSGVVVNKGSAVTSVEIGDRVAMSWSLHKKFNKIHEFNICKIEGNNASMQDAAMCHIGIFPMAALRKTKLEIGESMMVMGLGILGLMAVQFSKCAGAVPIIAVDPVKERREKALKFGADYALDPFEKDFVNRVKEITNGGVNTAIEVTGLGTGLNQCLDCMKKFGRIALLGCTRDKNFTVDYYRKIHGPGITIVGAHTMARPDAESSPHAFTQKDDIKTILKLCQMGRINLSDMVDEVYSPYDCEEVYTRLINDSSFPVVAQFDWRKL